MQMSEFADADTDKALVWIAGASGGIGRALVETIPWRHAHVIGISRSGGGNGVEHLQADLNDPGSWQRVGSCFREAVAGFDGGRIVFIHAAGTVDPIGFAGTVDTQRYIENVLINSASPQVLGHLFIEAVRDLGAKRHLMMMTSGAAKSIYPGWSSYGAAKACVDQWVRDVGAEQGPDGVQVLAVAPGTVNTNMQDQLRATSEEQFPQRQKFVDAHREGKLSDPNQVAQRIWRLLDEQHDNGSVLDLRQLSD
jgi:NAD(P)-dependent dehydrogenase (short-subunit alcohol dehydrogenase family)